MDLLQLWDSVCRQAAQLAEVVEQVPAVCACGDADAHLAGGCSCCDGPPATASQGRPPNNCHEILARLRADLAMLSQDLAAAGPPLEAAALERHRFELRRGVFLAASDLQQVVEAFRRASEAVAGFRRECAVARMQAVRRGCAELRDHCERVNADLQRGLEELQ